MRAAVDVGSTSVHALVAAAPAEAEGSDGLSVLLDESAFLGLGAAVDTGGRLGAGPTGDLIATLAGYADRGRRLGAVSVTVLGTEPLRRAADAGRVVRRLDREAGLALHVLTQREEALLMLVGATGGRRPAGAVAVVDVGGGSTEIVRVAPPDPPVVVGLPLGTARLTGRHVSHDPATPAEVAAMVEDAATAIHAAGASAPQEVVAVGGTAENLVRVVPGGTVDGILSRTALDATLAALATEPAELAAARYGIRPIRARLLPAGAAILRALLDRWQVDVVRVSPAGLREGAILATARAGRAWRDRLPVLAAGWRG